VLFVDRICFFDFFDIFDSESNMSHRVSCAFRTSHSTSICRLFYTALLRHRGSCALGHRVSCAIHLRVDRLFYTALLQKRPIILIRHRVSCAMRLGVESLVLFVDRKAQLTVS